MDADTFLRGLGTALREHRNAKGWSQEELGLATGIHRNYIGGIERNEREPTVRVVVTLAGALGLKPLELFARADQLAD